MGIPYNQRPPRGPRVWQNRRNNGDNNARESGLPIESSNYKGNPKNFDPFFHLTRSNNNTKFQNNGAQQPQNKRFPNNQTHQNHQAEQYQQNHSNQQNFSNNISRGPVQMSSHFPQPSQQPVSQALNPFDQQQQPKSIFSQPQFPQQRQAQSNSYSALALDFLDNLCDETYRWLVEDSEGDVPSCAELQYEIVKLLHFIMSQSKGAQEMIPQWLDAFDAENPGTALTNIINSTGQKGLVNLTFGAAAPGFGMSGFREYDSYLDEFGKDFVDFETRFYEAGITLKSLR
ncbi:hypothetical protein HD806DRAFT_545514 [Xylariaceae sp. AK1471]|nr:hypothetical protein HD806DRAFT_545514 [Xylariaceae sp. AK1471]